MLPTWGTSSGINKLLAGSSLSLDFSRSAYTLGGVPYTVASVPGYTFTRTSGGYAETVSGTSMFFPELRTNLVLQSGSLATSPWGPAGGASVSIPGNISDPSGGTNTAVILLTPTTGYPNLGQYTTFTLSSVYTFSIWLWARGANVGTAVSIDNPAFAGNGRKQIVLTATPTRYSITAAATVTAGGNSRVIKYDGSDTATEVLAWGAQVEPVTNPACTYPMDYIPTTTAAVSVSGGYGIANGGLMWFTGTRTNLFFPSNGSTAYNILSNVAVTATGVAGAPDGTSTATTLTRAVVVGDDRAQRNIAIANDNTTYTYSVFIRSGSNQQVRLVSFLTGGTVNPFVEIIVNISTGAIVSGTGAVTKVGSWWRISTNIANNTTGNTLLCALLYPSTTTGSVDYWGVQLETATDTRITYPTAYIPTTTAAVSVDTPRITNKGYLSEEARTNLLLQSQNFENAAWLVYLGTKIGASPIAAPDGTFTAYEVNLGTAGGAFNSASSVYQLYSGFTNGTTYSGSVYVRAKTGTTSIRIGFTDSISSNVSTSDITITTNWQRVSISGVAGSTFSGNFSIRTNTAGNSGNVYIWGAQLEAGAFATSYIPTTTAAATRAADSLTFTSYNALGTGNWSVVSNLTGLYVATGKFPSIYFFDDGTVNNALLSYTVGGGPSAYSKLTTSSVSRFETLISATAISSGSGKLGITNNANAVRGVANGGTAVSIGTYVLFTPNRLGIGPVQGYTQSLTVYPTALTDAQLQAITT